LSYVINSLFCNNGLINVIPTEEGYFNLRLY
jgi:hypothetical protein